MQSKHEENPSSSLLTTSPITSSFLLPINYIGVLNEMAQKSGAQFPEYRDLVTEGLPHCRVFTIACHFEQHVTHGRGYTIKSAKQAAAKAWFEIYSPTERALRTSRIEYACNVSAKAWSLGKAIFGWDQMGEDEVKKALSRIAMYLASLAANLTPTGMSIFIVQVAVEFGYTLDVLATKLIELFTTLAEHSTQLIQNVIAGIRQLLLPVGQRISQDVIRNVELIRNSEILQREVARRTALEMPEFTPQLIAGAAGALGGCAVLIAAVITGAKDFSSQKGFIKSITEFSTKIAKTKAGIFALIEMVKSFHVYVRDSVLAYLGQGVPSTIVRAYESLNPTHRDESVSAEKFFEMIETLNSIDGENSMGINPEALKDGEFVLYYISKITTQNMTNKFAIPANAAAGLMATQRALEQRVKIARVKHGARESKFDPFCIWLTGEAGVGKSTAVAFINTWLQSYLSKDPERFQLPAQDRMCFAANFTQEYHTGYNGQYIFTIDDMCQDQPHLLKNSSLMFFINAKSRVPSNVTQAALEDKMCPFDSKIIICTSNVSHPNRTKEICDRNALLRRRNMLVRMQMDESFPVDPVLQRKVKFTLIDPMDDKKIDVPIAEYETFADLMRDIVTQYVAHYDAELALDGKTTDVSAAEAFAEKLWNERAVATMYKIPEILQPSELIRQCKFEASRLGGCLFDIYQQYHWKLLVGLSALAAAAFATYHYMRKRAGVVQSEFSSYFYAARDFECGAMALEDPEVLVIYGTGFEDKQCDHVKNNHTAECPDGIRLVKEFDKMHPEEHALATYESKIVRAKPASRPTYNKELVRARAAARAIRSSFVEAMNIKSVVKVGITVNGQRREMNGVFVKDRFMLTCRHLFIGAKNGDPITVTEYPQFSQPRVSEHMFEENRMRRVIDGEDSVIYEMGFEVKSHRDITERFFQQDLPESFYAASVAVYPYQSCIEGRTQVLTRHVEYAMDDEESEFAMVRGFEMLERTAPGRSGSPIVTDERANRAPTIFGIQTSMMDDGTRGYFEAITKSQIKATLREFEQEKAIATMHYEPVVPEEMQHMCQQSLIYVCPAEKPVFQMQQTRLERSAIAAEYDIDEDLTEFVPSALRGKKDGKVVDVLAKSMAGFDRKYGRVDTRLADEVLREIAHEDRSVRKIRGLAPRVLTDHEVMNGLEGQGLKGVETKTSPGLPLVHMKLPGKPGKETWISRDDKDQRILCPEMWEIFRQHENMLKDGETPPYLAYACLKDELRPLAKVRELKTRSFIILPMLMNLMIRKYFGVWIAVQHGLHNKISSSVGIDVNTEWTALARRLLKVGSAIEDFDYADWDRSLHAEWFRLYADRVSAWYGDKKGSQGWRVRMKLMDILAHMPIQIGSHIVQTSGGNKSGCAITAEINSDVHDMLMLYVWKKVCKDVGKPELSGIEEFRNRVALALYGDDVVKATSASVAKWFNGNSICLEVEKLGMKITPGDKISTEFRIKTLDEVTFLKRRFMKMDEDCGEYRAPLDKAVIQRMMLWVHKSDEPLEACAANVKGALCEAFFWGEAFYNETMDRVEKAWNYMEAGGKPLPSVTYHVLWYNWTNKIRSELVPAQFQYSSGVRLETPDGAEV